MNLYLGDCLDVLKTLPDASVDAVVTDPPYELGFMGKKWDAAGIAYNVELWREALRVLKPGGHLLAFGGTRTYHRMACAIEDAGFEIRDSIHWLYGSGFPKSKNVGGGFGTALKPAHEPVVVARKPLAGTVADNVQQHGTGALNIDGTRVAGEKPATTRGAGGQHGSYSPLAAQGRIKDDGLGRWPPNILLSHTPECGETCAEDCAVAEMDRQSGTTESSRHRRGTGMGFHGAASSRGVVGHGDSGGASRFFPVFRYQAKASRSERNAGLDGFPEALPLAPNGSPNAVGASRGSLSKPRANVHPTVKPVELMRWLVRLVTPSGGVVLDPFTGSGTTGVAATLEGFNFIGIEREPEYQAIATARIEHARSRVREAGAVQAELFSATA